METGPVTYNTFWAIFIESAPGFFATVQFLRDTITGRSLLAKPAVFFMLWSMIFILAFPTMMSAMTAYDLTNRAYFRDEAGDNLMIPLEHFELLAYMVHDGKRAGLEFNDYPVVFKTENGWCCLSI